MVKHVPMCVALFVKHDLHGGGEDDHIRVMAGHVG